MYQGGSGSKSSDRSGGAKMPFGGKKQAACKIVIQPLE